MLGLSLGDKACAVVNHLCGVGFDPFSRTSLEIRLKKKVNSLHI